MKTYYVMWTYIANFSNNILEVQAMNPQDAVQKVLDWYSRDFEKKARIFVFTHKPVMVYDGREGFTESV